MEKNIVIIGCDGYTGWALTKHLLKINKGKVIGVDNFIKRKLLEKDNFESLIPTHSMHEKMNELNNNNFIFHFGSAEDYNFISHIFKTYKPDVIIHYGQIPSAPFSMKDIDNALLVTRNNVEGNLSILWAIKKYCPNTHLIKMATAGEWGQPNIEVPSNGKIEIEYKGRKDILPFPKQPGSFYHLRKAFESQDIDFACRIWGLCTTDLFQGIVFGLDNEKNEKLKTTFFYDEIWGTVINRFIVQTMTRIPLTVYGQGQQIRGFISLKDALKCVELYIDNPPKKGEYRIFNQLAEANKTILELAKIVMEIGYEKGFKPTIECIENPRIEKEKHYYSVNKENLDKLGFKPHDMKDEIRNLFDDLKPYIRRIRKEVIKPKINWR